MIPPDIARACGAWYFIPPTARRVETDEYLLLRYPTYYEHPLQLFGILPRRPLAETLDEALAAARDLAGAAPAEVLCWVRLTAPDGLDEALLERGATLDERLDVLARTVGDDAVADLPGPPPGVELRWSDSLPTFVDAVRLGTEVFGGTLPPDEALERLFADEREKVVAGGGGSVVAYLDGVAVGTAGVTVAGPDARLWGGCVLPRARRRGVYAALLHARLRYGVAHGTRLALVKGRVDSSAPLLRRTGFETFGQERSYLLPL
ncbi:GNAT family N-acetyltransferase [Nocardioides sambongensis]|uniref:GNAT family N-acetyltransferase n=1 Tax=Nocardioides sambongensis TaxID=2589074 RepID=UPI0011261827|nr:GNAT family N-acetyltransferase [Nocardioides sambongensis]